MNKTLYLKDDDGPLWDRARELSGDKLSPVIVEALKTYVAEKEKTAEGFHRIVINYADIYSGLLLKSQAFEGKWLVHSDENLVLLFEGVAYQVSVALTAKRNFAVLRFELPDGSGEATNRGCLDAFKSIEQIAAREEHGFLTLARVIQDRHGIVPVEELDI
jgi:hypothetical protein